MAQTKPVEKPADRGAVHINATPGEFDAECVERQFAILGDAGTNPFAMRRQLATGRMALPCRRKRAGGSMQDHHVVDKSRRHPEMPGRLPMAVTLLLQTQQHAHATRPDAACPWRFSFHGQSESQIKTSGNPEF